MPAHNLAIIVGVTPELLAARDPFRTSLAFINNDSTAIVYWATDDKSVSVGSGTPIFPRGSVTLVRKDGDETRLAIYAIADTVGTSVRVYESTVRE